MSLKPAAFTHVETHVARGHERYREFSAAHTLQLRETLPISPFLQQRLILPA